MNPFVRYQLPAILYAMLIFAISSVPRLAPPPLGLDLDDKFYHFVEYFIFGYLCARAFYYQRSRLLRDFALIIALVAGSLYAVSDELHQSFVPGRSADAGDLLADVFGVVSAVALFAALRSRRVGRRRKRSAQRPQEVTTSVREGR
jgi:VanZ family protein